VVTPALHAKVMREIIRPTVEGMAAEGTPYTGFLYAGLMIDASGQPRTLEFNCRLGDPETQPLMARIRSDFARTVEQAIAGHLDQAEIDWDRRFALGVVLAASGYPEAPRTGEAIKGLPEQASCPDTGALVFHAGTAQRDGETVTSGGRVLCVTGLGDSVRAAQASAYRTIESIAFDGMQFRRDIGFRALHRPPRT
jgi:phosphoribosylamine--glycine ligase